MIFNIIPSSQKFNCLAWSLRYLFKETVSIRTNVCERVLKCIRTTFAVSPSTDFAHIHSIIHLTLIVNALAMSTWPPFFSVESAVLSIKLLKEFYGCRLYVKTTSPLLTRLYFDLRRKFERRCALSAEVTLRAF
jgi:hypothetical protein